MLYPHLKKGVAVGLVVGLVAAPLVFGLCLLASPELRTIQVEAMPGLRFSFMLTAIGPGMVDRGGWAETFWPARR